MNNEHAIDALNELIETSKDGEKGFLECAEHVKTPQLKATLTERSRECGRAAAELQQMVRSLGGEPESSSSVAGALHRRWVDLKALVTGKSEEAILNECERGEDVALKHYREALGKELPTEARTLVERQLLGVQRNHDQIKALRNLARAS
ncbi:ferritin-like domain-containing protein [Metapseudomonas otitidis]|jgi:uncharacterized protein (TIGR02284 family)|uniref:PA2169 family four-helix-bundle protein n=1 Tax=Metapseudomonas otitidis TaxID=319939 RepID=A0A6S5RN12_9GAMM|nr:MULTISPECIES: PA2169 family four-helix-bundle protein [Pseudomonas]MDL5591392.1 PA2169 family four-helix-bundle protein [Bacillus subtilis]MCO7556357.1 PA2169 family four-helix-bundle protein [Pseudomonas otitidis]MCP1615639.1 uncharacterized protein (TIGR02284 family) [Pseudomonas otitidis]MDG9782168.1 PA2169 family four-helix-bundle protein [Pseudomonas otitidis]MDI6524610.1 PA2169 family four-helix-bundle protein [Pseudomonas otitidis]